MGETGADKELVRSSETLVPGSYTTSVIKMEERLSGRKVLITGATGFIGSYLAESLLSLGAKVTLIGPSLGWRPNVVNLVLQKRARFIKRKLFWSPSSPEHMESDFRELEYVIHLAYVMPCGKNPAETIINDIRLNVLGTARFIQQLPASISKICFASSAMVYGINPPQPVSETDCTHPVTAYAIGKLAAENYLQLFARESGISLAILRYATVYGPFEMVPRAIPNFIRSVLAGKPPVISGKGDDVRDYVHVSDVVEATLLALSHDGDSAQVFNIGTGIGCSTRKIAEKVIRLSGKALSPIHNEANRVPNRMVCDITRAATTLEYKPKVQIDKGLEDEFRFFANNSNYWRAS